MSGSGKSEPTKAMASSQKFYLLYPALSSALLGFMLSPRVVGCMCEMWLPINGRHTGVSQNHWLLSYQLLPSPRPKLRSPVMRMHLSWKAKISKSRASFMTDIFIVSPMTKSGIYLLPWRALKYFNWHSSYPESVCFEIVLLWTASNLWGFVFSFCQSWLYCFPAGSEIQFGPLLTFDCNHAGSFIKPLIPTGLWNHLIFPIPFCNLDFLSFVITTDSPEPAFTNSLILRTTAWVNY